MTIHMSRLGHLLACGTWQASCLTTARRDLGRGVWTISRSQEKILISNRNHGTNNVALQKKVVVIFLAI